MGDSNSRHKFPQSSVRALVYINIEHFEGILTNKVETLFFSFLLAENHFQMKRNLVSNFLLKWLMSFGVVRENIKQTHRCTSYYFKIIKKIIVIRFGHFFEI